MKYKVLVLQILAHLYKALCHCVYLKKKKFFGFKRLTYFFLLTSEGIFVKVLKTLQVFKESPLLK